MHQKKSDVQIGKDSFGLSSDFSPSAAAHHHHHHQLSVEIPPPSSPNGPHSSSLLSKRPVMTHSPTLSSLRPFSSPRPPPPSPPSTMAAAAARNLVPTQQAALRLLRRLRLRLQLFILLSLPSLYLLLSRPTRVFVLDLLLAFAFSAALFASVALALPRLPSLRPLSLKLKLPSCPIPRCRPAPATPRVLWFIGSQDHKPNPDDPAGGLSVQVYSNGDVYEGEFHRGKCSGSGVYHYYMSGRYEGDWVDEKYDGYGVETWARGSRYRGQYRKGMRHGYGVYRFYTGDVYAGEWSNGQSHGCGVHTCEDGSRYVGEFKWGVKHGLGHYHFRCLDLFDCPLMNKSI